MNSINKWISILLIAFLASGLVACNSSSSESIPIENELPVVTDTGIFIDSAVSGLHYQTATQEGTTNTDGEFVYVDGETISFSIGGLELPATLAKAVLTPLDLVGTSDVYNRSVVNIVRLLQSLDSDGDPSNGISIVEDAYLASESLSLTFDDEDFDALVANFVSNGGGNGVLIDKATAMAHFLASIGYESGDIGDNSDSLEESRCGQSGMIFKPEGLIYSIDTYMPMICQGSQDLNGIWLATSELKQFISNAGTDYEEQNNQRKLLSIQVMPDGTLRTKSCRGAEKEWVLNGYVWSRVGLDIHFFDQMEMTVVSNDRLSITNTYLFAMSFAHKSNSIKEELELIKVDRLNAEQKYAGFTINLNIDDERFSDLNEFVAFPENCFYEAHGQRMQDGTGAFGMRASGPYEITEDEKPETFGWTDFHDLNIIAFD